MGRKESNQTKQNKQKQSSSVIGLQNKCNKYFSCGHTRNLLEMKLNVQVL